MSNKLIKRSSGYEKVKEEVRNKIEKEGGINVSPDLIQSYTDGEDGKEDAGDVTYDEFFDILTELSNSGYILFKIVQISDGKEKRGIMICRADTTIAFAKSEVAEKKVEESKTE